MSGNSLTRKVRRFSRFQAILGAGGLISSLLIFVDQFGDQFPFAVYVLGSIVLLGVIGFYLRAVSIQLTVDSDSIRENTIIDNRIRYEDITKLHYEYDVLRISAGKNALQITPEYEGHEDLIEFTLRSIQSFNSFEGIKLSGDRKRIGTIVAKTLT